ncbi:MAG: DNA-binding protein Alba [Archaeoglobaceae archaeon]
MAENAVFVGNKPVMNYVLAVLTQFNSGATEVSIKARGKAISRAVDVAEIVRKRFLPDVDVKDIKISTEQVTGEQGTANVSAIEIVLQRK